MSFFDRNGAGACNAGETIAPALEILGTDRQPIDLTGGTFAYVIIDRDGVVRHNSPASLTNGNRRAVADLPGEVTTELAGIIGLEHFFAEGFGTTDRADWLRARLSIRRGGAAIGGGGSPGQSVWQASDRGVVRTVAMGAPGKSAWEVLGVSFEEYDQPRIDAETQAARAEAAANSIPEALTARDNAVAAKDTAEAAAATAIASAASVGGIVFGSDLIDYPSVFERLDGGGRDLGTIDVSAAGIAYERALPQDALALMAPDGTIGSLTSFFEEIDPETITPIVDRDGRQVSPDPSPAGGSVEVIAARGSRGSLNDRLSVSIDAFGAPLAGFSHPERLVRWRMKRQQRRDGLPSVVSIVLLGDSWAERSIYTWRVSRRLKALFGDAGLGFVRFSSKGAVTPSYAGADDHTTETKATVTLTGAWTPGSWAAAFPTNQADDGPVIGLCDTVSSASGDRVTVQLAGGVTQTTAKLLYSPGGNARYSWDNGATWTALDLSTGYSLDLSGVPGSAGWKLIVEATATNCHLTGVVLTNGQSGVLVHKIAKGGSASDDWVNAAGSASWQAHMTALAPDLLFICHGTNDQNPLQGVSAAQTAANYTALANAARAVVARTNEPPVDLLYAAPAENLRGIGQAMSDFRASIRAQAEADGAAYVDFQAAFGPVPATSYSAWWVGGSDQLHPNEDQGGSALASLVLSLLEA